MITCEKLGYKVGDRFEVIHTNIFSKGSIIELIIDDQTDCPLFKLIEGSCLFKNANGKPGGFTSLCFIEKI